MFSTLSPYRDSRPRSDRPVRGQVEGTSRSKLVGYSTSRFMILVILGLVSFVCAAPLQPEPAPTPTSTTPSLVASTLYSSSSSSSSSSSTAIALTPSFVPRTDPEDSTLNPEDSESSDSESAALGPFDVQFTDTRSNDNMFLQKPMKQLLKLANIKVSKFIGVPFGPETDIYFELRREGKIVYHGAISNSEQELSKATASQRGYQFKKNGLCGYVNAQVAVKRGRLGIVYETSELFKVKNNKVISNTLTGKAESGEKAS
ncbi:hypothetical protein DFJ43DRAFT_1084056 [Lentinula guzmanii]|uniref:Uncharacterized protein n=1 Tax=Lentinula guzmanii TaxID=2804957 RepID=A0AA38J8J2_9AGAR|nr:hypothetical protein DFJ43DRAFT_1084056 [Lentinula guzmanii]